MSTDKEKLVSKKDLSKMTGLSVRTIEHAKNHLELPYRKIGRMIYYVPSEVECWIDERKVVKTA